MKDEVFRGGAFDPYNSSTTSAKWRTAIIERDEARRRLLAEFLFMARRNAKALVDLAKIAINRIYGRL